MLLSPEASQAHGRGRGLPRVRRLRGFSPIVLGRLLPWFLVLAGIWLGGASATVENSWICRWNTLADSLGAAQRAARLARAQQNPAELLRAETAYEELLEIADRRMTAAVRGLASSSAFDSLAASPLAASCTESFGRVVRALIRNRSDIVTSALVPLWLRHARVLDPEGESTFFLGLDALENERYEESALLLEKPVTPLLAPYAQWLRIRALEKLSRKRSGAAALLYLRGSPKHRFRDLLTLHAGEFLLDQDRLEEAARLLQPWVREVGLTSALGVRGQTLLAELHRRQGHAELFRAAFFAAAGAGEISGREGNLHLLQAKRLLQTTDSLEAGQVITCAKVLCSRGSSKVALETWHDYAPRLSSSDSLVIGRLVLDKLYGARRHKALLRLCTELEQHASAALKQRAQVIAGRVYRRLGDLAGVNRAWRAAAAWKQPLDLSSGGTHAAAAFALWELGRELEDTHEWVQADSAYSMLVRRYPDHDRARVAKLRGALCRFSSGRRAEALEQLTKLCESAPERFVGSPCYWLAALGRTDHSRASLLRAAGESRPGFHALRSAEAMAKEFVPSEPPRDSLFWEALSEATQQVEQTWPWPPGPDLRSATSADRVVDLIQGRPLAEAGDLLQAYGYRSWARHMWSQVSGYRALSLGEQIAFYRALGDYDHAIGLAFKLGDVMSERYPVGYGPEVNHAAVRFGFSPVFILAVMRQESLLNATVRSRAGAVGLMQLMPATAKRLADSLRLGSFELERPRDNILLGTAHLRELFDLADGSIPMALAAYNAGWGHAVRWLPSKTEPAELTGWDAYIERISFRETRRFVKSVLMHYWSYMRSYPTPGPRREPSSSGTSTAPGTG